MLMGKKNRWTIWNWFCYTGLPWLVISIFAGVKIKSWFYLNRYHRVFEITGKKDIQDILGFSFMLWLIVFLKNGIWANSDKQIGLFTWMEPYRYIPPKISPRKIAAMHPPIDSEYLSVIPNGLVLARKGKKYVRFMIEKGHALSAILLGTPGSGKSTILLSTLIWQLQFFKPKNGQERQVFFILDCKPELRKKASYRWDKHIRELSIRDRSQYGWDPYFNLDENSSADDILSAFDLMARAFMETKNEKNEFFYQSARTIFKYALFAEHKKGHTFLESMDNIQESDLTALIEKLLNECDGKPDLMKIKKGLAGYAGKKKSDAFQSIELTFRENMEIFLKDNVRFFLDGNPRKLSPMTLEEKISVAFTIKTTDIKEYKTILRLVIMQLIHHCENRDEETSHLLTLVIDEAYRLGVINWIDFLSVCRSKQTSCILAFQSLSQMQSVWSKEDATSLVEMVSAIAVLSCTDPQTQKMICDWAGTYQEEHITTNIGKDRYDTYSRSYSDKRILEPSDLMQLKRNQEIVMFLDGQYYCADCKGAKYFNIKELNDKSKQCLASYKEE